MFSHPNELIQIASGRAVTWRFSFSVSYSGFFV